MLILDGDTVDVDTLAQRLCGHAEVQSAAVWPSTYVYQGDTLQERIASSDLSRSNCQRLATPRHVELGILNAGEHTLKSPFLGLNGGRKIINFGTSQDGLRSLFVNRLTCHTFRL